MTRRGIAALLLIVAAALVLGLVRYDTNTITTYTNHTVHRTLRDDPVIIISMSVSDFACFAGTPCKLAAAARIKGLFPRAGVSLAIALYAGIVAPLALMCMALIILLPSPRQILKVIRVLAAVTLLTGGTYLVAQIGAVPLITNRPLLWGLAHFWPELIPSGVGLILLAGAATLLWGAYERPAQQR
jgi:hypothetical protein